MRIIIENIKMPVGHKIEDVLLTAREIVRSDCIEAKKFEIYKQSIDARRKNNIHYVYSVIAETDNKKAFAKNIRPIDYDGELKINKLCLKRKPVVVGMGPCGLFSALVLTESGNPPIIIERGGDVDLRTQSVKKFWEKGILDTNSNVQFGEGGAGTFSDGKLNTRIGDVRQRYVLETFVRFGAPSDILYKAKPHIGTDILRKVVKNIREYLIENGAEVRFNTTVTDIKIKDGHITEVQTGGGEVIACDNLVLAIGHSSRDTYEMLQRKGVEMSPKPFAIGVRIEHSQQFINNLQYGDASGLPPADYRVVHNGKERSCYSFCMCPGGTVVNASSEDGYLAVNGMSEYKRDGKNANSALVVTVKPTDFEKGVLGGVAFQRKYEKMAYMLGGGRAPIQLAEDFVKDRATENIMEVSPTVTGGYKIAELKNCLPEFVTSELRVSMQDFERRMRGFASNGAVLTGVETRTSAPVRIERNENLQSVNVIGLYPAGEGAGYAGGIVSAAVDGIRVALEITK